ncbi:MAG TPA: tetratricopeptide repeat protein [Novosphingobium sp.]|nr:tetratricopeptide repeat protein [Novosphingobium sp.]
MIAPVSHSALTKAPRGGGVVTDAAAVVDDARNLLQQGRHAEALARIAPVLAGIDARGRGHAVLYCAHDQMEGLAYLGMAAADRQVELLSAENCDALFLQAYALTEMGRKGEAVAALERLTHLSPSYPHYFVELGYAYRQTGQAEKAWGAYDAARKLAEAPGHAGQYRRDHAAALRGLGFLLYDRKDWDGAERAYRDSLIDDPDSRIAQGELAAIAKKREGGQLLAVNAKQGG